MPPERVAVAGVLRLEILRAVFADDARSSSATYFVATTTVTSSPTSACKRW